MALAAIPFDDNSNGTVTIIPAVSGKQIYISQILITSQNPEVLTLMNGTTELFPLFFGSNSGILHTFCENIETINPNAVILSVGQAFKITKVTSTDRISGMVWYNAF